MKDLPTRKSARLHDFDYRGNRCYFITICVKDKHEMLGTIGEASAMVLSRYGLVVRCAVDAISTHYAHASVDSYVIMPNHVHMLLRLNHGRQVAAPTREPADVSTIIGQMKRHVSMEIGFPLWQKSFHDHIVRNHEDYARIAHYINTNPQNWLDDCYYNIDEHRV
ncbi:MAG: hypothetical protein FWB76_06735 [Oscillospiraceae bacterium]|nr:hypothetical protein [Oscillospiraceae bacterium]